MLPTGGDGSDHDSRMKTRGSVKTSLVCKIIVMTRFLSIADNYGAITFDEKGCIDEAFASQGQYGLGHRCRFAQSDSSGHAGNGGHEWH